MAIISCTCFRTIFLCALIILCFPRPSASVPLEELERAITVLRVRGRALFANAIITSDLLFDLLSVESLTLFGPTDSMLFDLDMTHSFHYYVSTLRHHSVPLRLAFSDLQLLPNSSTIPTLLPSHNLILTRPSSSNDSSVYLDGVELLLPGLFYGQNLAVHGLEELLPLNKAVNRPIQSHQFIGFSPAPAPHIHHFFGLKPAQTLRVEDVSPPTWGEDIIIGNGGR